MTRAPGKSRAISPRFRKLNGSLSVILAARGYFRSPTDFADRIQIRFDGVPLPGYGWIFPLGDGRANVGAGTIETFWSSHKTAQSLMDGFTKRRSKEGMMASAAPTPQRSQ